MPKVEVKKIYCFQIWTLHLLLFFHFHGDLKYHQFSLNGDCLLVRWQSICGRKLKNWVPEIVKNSDLVIAKYKFRKCVMTGILVCKNKLSINPFLKILYCTINLMINIKYLKIYPILAKNHCVEFLVEIITKMLFCRKFGKKVLTVDNLIRLSAASKHVLIN